MDFRLTDQEAAIRQEARSFVDERVRPFATQWDAEGRIPDEIIHEVADRGWMGAALPQEWGGLAMSQAALGILHEEIGRGCSSLRSLLTVHHNLVAETLARWGSPEQKERWLRELAQGKRLGAFALSEPGAGADVSGIQAKVEARGEGWRLSGTKKWITFGQRADLFLVAAQGEKGISTFWVDAKMEGVRVTPLNGMLGTRASDIAQVNFDQVQIEPWRLFGREGMGFMQILNTALDNGRYSVACGSLGILRAATELAAERARDRETFGQKLGQHSLVRQKLAQMGVAANAAAALCRQAGWLRDQKHPDALMQTNVAKYFASKSAMEAATACVQLHGAAGCHPEHEAQRLFRDAKIMEIIEGANELQEDLIGQECLNRPIALMRSE